MKIALTIIIACISIISWACCKAAGDADEESGRK